MTERDRLIKAKIPCEESGIEIRKTICDICTPGPHCGIDAYVKDGVVIKVEGTKGFPGSDGRLCTKGASNRQYLYRKDRLKTPLKRVGVRGSGQFEPVSWDEALDICAQKFLELREQYGAESVAWMTGYSKWFRPWLHRLTHSFGSLNYITESSACHCAEVMSYKSIFGASMLPDMRNVKNVFCWGSNGFANAYLRGNGLYAVKERGGKIITIDPRMTHTAQKISDLYLRPRIGTDGYLANAMANRIIRKGKADEEFIRRYVHGYEEYKEMVSAYSLEEAERVTGVPKADIEKAVEIFLEDGRTAIMPGNGLTHRKNGFCLHRAVLSLMVITGRVDKPGAYLPEHENICHSDGGFPSHEAEFFDSVRPKDAKPAIGSLRFPIWREYMDEAQGMDFVRHVMTADPYPLKGAACFGVNHMMYVRSSKFLEAIDRLDFVMATDIFDTELCRHADIVLPVSTSFERSEVKCYGGRFVNYTTPVIDPVYDNRDDVWVMAELAKRMHLGDELLESGYDAGAEFILRESGITDWEAVKRSPLPVPAPNAAPYRMGSFLEKPLPTPTGKIELYSEVIAKYKDQGFHPLPEAESGDEDVDRERYPYTMMSGARIPAALHTRTTKSSWLRSLSPEPSVEINPLDARKLGVKTGDLVKVYTAEAEIFAPARVTEVVAPGEAAMFHGFREANVNELIAADHLDPYTGFPGYKQFRCGIEKAQA